MTHECSEFLGIIEKAGGDSFFDDNEDGSLSTVVHTGKLIEAFYLSVSGYDAKVIITTTAMLCVDESNVEKVGQLLLSVKDRVMPGLFYISEKDRTICYQLVVSLKDLSSLENPFDAVFYGCEMFGKYGTAILKALAGQTVFYI